MSSSSLVQIAIARQTALGVPATTGFVALPKASDGLTGTVNTVESSVSTGVNRISGTALPTGFTFAGDIGSEFREEIWDEVLAGVAGSDWDLTGATEDVLTIGTNPIYFTVVKFYPYNSIGKQTDQYQDCVISNISITTAQQEIVGFTFGIAASTLTRPAAPPWGDGNSPDEPPVKNTLLTCNALTGVEIKGTEVPSIVQSADINIQNTINAIFDARQCSVKEQSIGTAAISGTVSMFHDDDSDVYFDDALNNVAGSVQLTLAGETKVYRFFMPNVVNTSPGPDTSGDDVTIAYPWSVADQSPEIYRTK